MCFIRKLNIINILHRVSVIFSKRVVKSVSSLGITNKRNIASRSQCCVLFVFLHAINYFADFLLFERMPI